MTDINTNISTLHPRGSHKATLKLFKCCDEFYFRGKNIIYRVFEASRGTQSLKKLNNWCSRPSIMSMDEMGCN